MRGVAGHIEEAGSSKKARNLQRSNDSVNLFSATPFSLLSSIYFFPSFFYAFGTAIKLESVLLSFTLLQVQ
jgi:hypothetical protein